MSKDALCLGDEVSKPTNNIIVNQYSFFNKIAMYNVTKGEAMSYYGRNEEFLPKRK